LLETIIFTPDASHPGLPYREVGIDTPAEIASEEIKGRNTVAECYTKILADLTFAENNIASTFLTRTRATKNAAIAFKTRVNLAKRDWNGVITEFNKISSAYSLAATPKGAFSLSDAVQTNSEAVFYIAHGSTAAQNPGVNGALASQYNRRELVSISPIIWRDPSWLSDDKRRQTGEMTRSSAAAGILTTKYTDGVNYTDASPVIRFAEVLLNVAEAHARLGNTTLGLANLNLVRNRSLATPGSQAYTASSFATATNMVGAILKERRIEFLMEGRRWGDIHRLQNDDLFPINGIPAKLANAPVALSNYTLGTPYSGALGVATIPSTDRRFLWPIPQIETSVNPILKAQQNPGW
jgi:starch-binding outer membrane protein, SusD/RagB family